MKKILSLILTLSLLMSMVATIGVSAYQEEVIFSDSFENGDSKWKHNSGRSNENNTKISKDKASDGKFAAWFYDPDESTYGYRSEHIAAEPLREYTVCYDAYNEEGMGAKAYVEFYNKENKRISSVSFGATKVGEWTSLQKKLTAPDGTAYMCINFTGSGAGTGVTYIDNVKVFYDKDAKVIDWNAPLDIKVGDVLFSESFEGGLGAWDFSPNENAKESSEKATDGTKSVYIVDESDKEAVSIISPAIRVKEGYKYTAFADFIGAEGGFKIYIQFFDKAGTRLASSSASAKAGNYTGKISSAAPVGAMSAKVMIYSNTAGKGKTYIDNVKLSVTKEAMADAKSMGVIKDLNEKLKTAKPGDTLLIPDGTYDSLQLDFNAKGTESAPIILKAENPGKAVFTGASTIIITGSYLILEGVLFENATHGKLIDFALESDHCQIRECAVINSNPLDEEEKPSFDLQQRWVYVRGQYNKISNCYFRGKVSGGMMVEVIRSGSNPDYKVIENSYFGDFKETTLNGFETIRIGLSENSLSDSYTTVQGCFFEQCDSENETISVKSGKNYVLNNTLYNNKGGIVLRHGNGTEVRGNLVIGGEQTNNPTGVRVIGENHVVADNYFYNTPVGSSAFFVSDGNPNPLIHEYTQVKNLDAHNNTFVNNDIAIVGGDYSPSATNSSNRIIPPEGKIYNNAIISFKGSNALITGDKNATGLIYENNYAFGKELKYQGPETNGITVGQFDYEVKDGYFIPKNGTGANIEEIKKAPKSPFDVMPKWVKEQYYDTGKITFDIVENDPFNKPETSVYDLLPIEEGIEVFLNGSKLKFDVLPQLINSRTMVPMRKIFEAFGAEVSWDEATATASAQDLSTAIKITENSDTAYVNGKEYKLDSPAVIIDGRFLVPIRFISESFGANVGWVDATETVVIDYKQNSIKGEFKPLNTGIEKALTIYAMLQSGDDGANSIKNIFDGSLNTKWASQADADGNNAFGIFDLGSVKVLDKLHMAMQKSATRIYSFDILVSEDGVNYTKVIDKKANTDKNGAFEIHDLGGVSARYVKFVGYGNNENAWNNITEFVLTEK